MTPDPNLPVNVLHEGIPFEDYIRASGINASGLKKILRSPAHYQATFTDPEEPTESLVFGKWMHLRILEPELFAARAVYQPKLRKNRKVEKEALAEWEASLSPDAIVIPECWEGVLERMADRVYAHPAARRLLERGVREGTFFWTDPETGLLCKGRPDFVSATGIIVDLKSTIDARKDAFAAAMWRYRYDVQAAHYAAGAEVTGLATGKEYAFMVVEKEPPYEICVYACAMPSAGEAGSVLGLGTQWRTEAMRIYKRCRETGIWPGYSQRYEPIEMPRWAKGVGEQ